MSKSRRSKSKQSVSSAKPRSYSELYKDDNTVPQTNAANRTQPEASVEKKGSDQVDWKNEYAYVFSDLRVLSIVSIALFALIIGIGFIL